MKETNCITKIKQTIDKNIGFKHVIFKWEPRYLLYSALNETPESRYLIFFYRKK